MMNIKITDVHSEMEAIGRELQVEKQHIYTEKLCKEIYSVIDRVIPDASQEEKNGVFYRSIYDYWVYGSNINEEFFYNFKNKTHEEKKEFLTVKNRFPYMHHINKKEDSYLLNDKYTAYKILKPYFKREVIEITGEEDFEKFAEYVKKHPTFVVKPADLGLAIGIHKETINEGDDVRVAFEKLLAEGMQNKSDYRWSKKSSIVLEELIPQASPLQDIHPYSVNAVRCTTIRVNGETHVFYPWLKIGMDGEFATCAVRGSVLAGIDPETGIVKTNGLGEYCQPETEVHPMTGVKIKGFQIPKWEEMIAMAKEMAELFPTIHYIGWDMVYTDDGWCVMEGNFAGEFMGQLTEGRGMKKELEQLIGWKPDYDFWWQEK